MRRDSEQKGTYNTDDYRKAEQALTECNFQEAEDLFIAMKRQLERVEMCIEEGKKTADLVTGGNRGIGLTLASRQSWNRGQRF